MAQSVFAAPLDKSYVGEDAKWLAHIDVEALMNASVSGLAIGELKEQIKKENDSKVSVDIDMVLAEIKSVTAYGAKIDQSGDTDGVLLIKTGNRFQAIVDGFIAHQELENEGEAPLKRLEDKPFTSYVLDDELYIAFPQKDLVIASKYFEQIEKAFEVVRGNSKNLAQSDDSLLLNNEDGFFLIATATGLSGLKDMPPQARILQKTKGGQLSIGEDAEDLRANLVLSTQNREVATQLYRIVQGMLALASFAQVENQEVMDVVDRIVVEQGENWVSIDFRYPAEKVLSLLKTLIDEGKHEHGDQGEHSSSQRWQHGEEQECSAAGALALASVLKRYD